MHTLNIKRHKGKTDNKTIEYVFGAGGQEDRDIYLKEQAHPTMGTGSSEIDRAGSAG